MVARPRVTIVIPTYNRSGWLRQSLASALEQTYPDVTVLVSDNASDDDTAEVVRSFDDDRVTYVRRPENVGLLANHNLSLGAVETDFCMVVADDDVMGPALVEATVAMLDAHPKAALAHTRFDLIDGRGHAVATDVDWTYGLTATTVEPSAEFIRRSMVWSCRVCASVALIRTAAMPKTLFEAEDFPAIDFGLWLRMALDADVAFLAENHGAYRVHGDSHSAAFGAPIDAGYVQGTEIITRLRAVKERFLVDHAARLGNVDELRRLADEGRRRELVAMVRNVTLPGRRFSTTSRALRAAVRVDPRVAVDIGAVRLLAASVLGGRKVDRIKQRTGRP